MSTLRKSARREPLTWWRYDVFGSVRVVCTEGHASLLQHQIMPDGSLVAPQGQLPSLHCGHDGCDESLPLKLEDWTP